MARQGESAAKATCRSSRAARLPISLPSFQAAGNAAFAAGDWQAAIDAFGRAIALDETNHVLYSNRSAALVREREEKRRAAREGPDSSNPLSLPAHSRPPPFPSPLLGLRR